MSHKWTQAERDFIKKKYKHWSANRIAEYLGVGMQAVQGQCYLMGLKKKVMLKRLKRFNEQESQFIRDHYQTMDINLIAKTLHRSKGSVYVYANKQGFRKRPGAEIWNKIKWSPAMINYIKKNYQSKTNSELARVLGVKLTSTRKVLYALGLKRMDLEYWTEDQTNYLIEKYQTTGDVELTEYFQKTWPKKKGWTKKHIEKKRRYLKLKRTAEQLAAIQQRNVDQGRFLLCPVKRWETTGQAPEGTIRFWRENEKGRMIPRIKINGKWLFWSRYTWQKTHGVIPEGMNIIFKDDNPRNMSIENLLMVSDAELTARNFAKGINALSDNYVAAMMSIKNPTLRKQLKQHPHLLELKRNQLKLERELNQKSA